MSDLTGKVPTITHFDDGSRKPITELWAWVSTEPDGGEGIVAASLPDPDTGEPIVMPLVGGDRERIESPFMRRVATATRIHTGRPVRLVRFTTREVIETLK
jgi:hypothetical protein